MISDISKTVMKTINAIQKHREKFGDDEVIIRYYKTHVKSYNGHPMAKKKAKKKKTGIVRK